MFCSAVCAVAVIFGCHWLAWTCPLHGAGWSVRRLQRTLWENVAFTKCPLLGAGWSVRRLKRELWKNVALTIVNNIYYFDTDNRAYDAFYLNGV